MLNIIRSAFCIVKRCISSKEAAAHLRPFYFAVHPDRFRSHPSVYSANEVALQEYNQYFNTICSKTGPIPKPISLRFFIRDSDKSDRFREIVLLLRGTDVFEIIAITLRAFGLPTDGVPRLAKLGQNSYTTYSSAKETVVYTLFDFISKRRNEAIKAREVHRAFTVEASIQIKYLKEKFGIIEILWCSGWDEQSFVVKLKNLHMLSTMIPLNELEMFYNALRDRKLRFGDSSYACFDGGIQLSVRDVLEGWRTVLLNVSINRGLIETKQNNAQSTLAIISRLLNGAKVIVADDANLCEIIDHLEIFEKRMSSFSDNHRGILKSLCFVGMEVVIYGYCDSAFHSPNGRLTIPHYVFADELIEYLNENATELERRLKQFRASSDELKSLREYCIGCLNLENLTWEEKLSLDEVKESMERLKDVNIATRKSLSGLSIHLSSVEDCSVTNYGVIIVPLIKIVADVSGVAMADDDSEVGLPQKGLNLIIKDVIPEVRVANESRELLNLCCVEFVHHVSREAQRISLLDQRKTICHEHIQKVEFVPALMNLGFPSDFLEAADSVLNECRIAAANKLKRKNSRLDKCGIPEHELYLIQQQLIQKAREEQLVAEAAEHNRANEATLIEQQQQQKLSMHMAKNLVNDDEDYDS